MFVLGVLALYAVSAQLRASVARGEPVVNFFSLFTTQSNIFAGLILIFVSNRGALRGAATLYMTITGIVYALLLAHDDPSLWHWYNLVLHYVVPAALLALWFVDPPDLRASYVATVLAWLAYPLAYLIYTQVRGSLIHWYPYGFLDPRNGLGGFAINIALIALFATLVTYGLARYAKLRRTAAQRT
jgi:hypothetical protein